MRWKREEVGMSWPEVTGEAGACSLAGADVLPPPIIMLLVLVLVFPLIC